MCYYWGKADSENLHLLVYHCLDVAAVGRVRLEKSPSFTKREAKASGLSKIAFAERFTFFLALHDIGKFDVRFQNLRPDLLKKKSYKDRKEFTTDLKEITKLQLKNLGWRLLKNLKKNGVKNTLIY